MQTTQNLSMTCSDLSSSSPTSWLWDFGDGNTSTAQNPTHTYAAAGTYTVCLTASNACGSDSTCSSVTVSCAAPVAAWSNTNQNLSASFTDLSTVAPSSWLWDFGDGSTSTMQNPNHTYAAPGTYTVCLTVSNPCGSDSSCTPVTIDCPMPVASWNNTSQNLNVSFTDLSAPAPTSWLWDFGDGNTSMTQNPNHTYAADGSYTVCLTSTNSCGSE